MMVAARLMTRLIDLLSMLILTRILQPADFGLVAIAASLSALMEAILELPINQALLRLPAITRAHYDTAFTIGLIRGVVLMGVLMGAAVPMAHLYHDGRLLPLICFLALSPFARGIMSPRMAEFQKHLNFRRDFAIEITGKGVSFVAGMTIAFTTHSYWAIAINSVLYSIVMMAESYRLAPYHPRLSLKEYHTFHDFIGWMTIAQVVSAINWQFERLLFGKLRSQTTLGFFTTASDITNIPFLALFGPMARPLLATFSHFNDDRPKLAASYQKASAAMVAIGLPLLIGESLVSERTVRVIAGPEWSAAAPMIKWLALSLTPALFTLPTMSLLMAKGQTRTVLRRNVLEFSIKGPLLVAGVMLAGFWGVVGARFVAELAADLYCLTVVRSLTGLTIRAQFYSWRYSAIGALGMALVVPRLEPFLPSMDEWGRAFFGLAVCGIVGALSYMIIVFAAWTLTGRPDCFEATVFRRLRRVG